MAIDQIASFLRRKSESIDSRQSRPSLVQLLAIWRERARSRAQLRELDDRSLRDIGVSRAEAMREAARPAWEGEMAPFWSRISTSQAQGRPWKNGSGR